MSILSINSSCFLQFSLVYYFHPFTFILFVSLTGFLVDKLWLNHPLSSNLTISNFNWVFRPFIFNMIFGMLDLNPT